MADSRFRVIDGGATPLPGRQKRNPGETELALCSTCLHDVGVASNIWTKVRMGPKIRRGAIGGGVDCWVCAICLTRGKVTRLT